MGPLTTTGLHLPFVIVKRSNLHGLGLFAHTKLLAGTHVGRYTGPVMRELGHDETRAAYTADEIVDSIPGGPHNHLLMMKRDDGMMCLVNGVDTVLGCMNHSEVPNVHGDVDGNFTVIKDVEAGTELLINYNTELTSEGSVEELGSQSEDDQLDEHAEPLHSLKNLVGFGVDETGPVYVDDTDGEPDSDHESTCISARDHNENIMYDGEWGSSTRNISRTCSTRTRVWRYLAKTR